MNFNNWLIIEEVSNAILGEMAQELDDELLGRVNSGDHSALDQLIARWQPRVLGWVRRKMTRNEDDAEDISQQAMLNVVNALQKGVRPTSFKGWIFRVTKNASNSYFRKRKEEPIDDPEETRLSQGPNRDADGMAVIKRDDPMDPAKIASDHEEQGALRNNLGQMKDYQQDALRRRYFQGQSEKESSDDLGIPQGTVKRRVHAAKRELQNIMRRQGFGNP